MVEDVADCLGYYHRDLGVSGLHLLTIRGRMNSVAPVNSNMITTTETRD